MEGKVPARVVRGVLAGLGATVIQTIIGKTEEILFLPPHEDSDIAPRFMARLAADLGTTLSPAERWTLGTVFHFGYGVFWGGAYALAYQRSPVRPLVGGTLLGGLIYGITFPRWGGAVQTRTERPPSRRSDAMEGVALSVCFSFGLATALLFGHPDRS